MSETTPKGIDRNLTSYGDPEFSKYIRRAFLGAAGLDTEDVSRPIIGIASTVSDYNPCHGQMPDLIEAVKRGVLEAGGLPFVFPTISLHEIFCSPTTMLFRNLLAMETEEMITAQPMDAVILMGGCDKTVPAQLMAAASANIPAVQVVSGAMRTGSYEGTRLGACTDCRRYWAQYRAGEIGESEIAQVTQSLCSTPGSCMVMGTASTMASIVETLGLLVPGGATPLSGTGDRMRVGVQSGRLAVQIAQNGHTPDNMLTRGSFLNAIIALTALGGSTNAIVHLLALARRANTELTLDDLHYVAQTIPLLVDCKPSGSGYMEDFHNAGGVPTLLKALESKLDLSVPMITGQTLGEYLKDIQPPQDWQTTIRTLDNPLGPEGSLAVIRGNLAPDGAILKTAAASKELFSHKGPAIVFESSEDAAERIDDPALNITPEHVLVLRNAGPVAGGMPESGSLPIPKYLAQQGVKDMVRISDARMSGTSYGTVVLHCSPEAATGGPLGLVRDGDQIELNVADQRLDLLIDETEREERQKAFTPPPRPKRGWRKLYADHVLPAHLGADLDFL
ncbi:MAG: dihydroxy-acid dehydratase [Candidatus Latescibacteria bacterium]|jgi:dihydroxy-acid dehydratase|nr:dihydroxy-acid dehydratase [Candidatus Latescibacterota bacterium]